MLGKKLGNYLIDSRLGAGGMGEVYKASDTRLGRSVAVKVLPDGLAQDADRIARFEREAQLLAALNHANIAALYGLEEHETQRFLVMELVDGETLAERIARNRLSVSETLKIAHQILEALEAAHEKGIVHRDLKPANIKITSEGKVKVLDFGLAKAIEVVNPYSQLSNSPTLSIAATNAGVILGTAAYMSPEQAKGATADARSDIFSFGSILYEMLAGQQAFPGDTIPEILAGILAKDPDWNALPENLNPRIVEVLRRCLEKNPRRRWHAIADLRVEIEAMLADSAALLLSPRRIEKPSVWKRSIPLLLTATAAALIAGLLVWNFRSEQPPVTVARFPFVLPPGQDFPFTGRQLLSIAPDGKQFVYAVNNRFYLKSMQELEPVLIQGTESLPVVTNPVVSPDGQSIAFASGDGTVKRISISGGAPVTICQIAVAPFGISWGTDNNILIGQGSNGIVRVSANGGQPETIIKVKQDEIAHGPQILPGGDLVLFTLASVATSPGARWDLAKVVIQSLRSGERKVLIDGGSDARYLPTGHIVYALRGTLFAIPFDINRLETTGGPSSVVEGVRNSGGATGTSQFSVSGNGSLVYIAGQAATVPQSQFAFVDRKGVAKPFNLPVAGYGDLRISPNGKQLAFSINDGNEQNIWVYELSGASSMRRLTFGATLNHHPIWSPDGEHILYRTNRGGDTSEFWQLANGTGTPERLTKADPGTTHGADSFVPGTQKFIYVLLKPGSDLWMYSLEDKKATPVVQDAGNQSNAFVSPDGHWLAYQSDETGRFEIYVQPFPPTGGKFQITTQGGQHPLWSLDGQELFYENAGHLTSVAIHTQPTFTFGNPIPMPLPQIVQLQGNQPRQYGLMPDGQQFIVKIPPASAKGPPPAPQIQVVLNWFEELKQRSKTK